LVRQLNRSARVRDDLPNEVSAPTEVVEDRQDCGRIPFGGNAPRTDIARHQIATGRAFQHGPFERDVIDHRDRTGADGDRIALTFIATESMSIVLYLFRICATILLQPPPSVQITKPLPLMSITFSK
jgi:hypothetical protein